MRWRQKLLPWKNDVMNLLPPVKMTSWTNWNIPLFHVGDLKPQLYEKAKPLKRAREVKLQLKYLQSFIKQCRFAQMEQGYCKEIPAHWTDDVDIWSMTDFVDIKNNVFSERIQEIIKRLEEHIVKNHCEVSSKKSCGNVEIF